MLQQKIVECVPNFSEGRDKKIIDAIADAIRSTNGVTLLDVDAGYSTNRTVYTLVGAPDAVVNGALNGAKIAMKLIDMRKHSGEHKRLGALDVCPFIPVKNVEMEECIHCAKNFAEKLAKELNVPVYLYGFAAKKSYRQTVPQIRAGEYEGLPEKLMQSEWTPDYGPNEFIANWGATMSGARKFLIAFNVNLISTKEQAHKIALNIREQGRGINELGRLKCVQAMGWWLSEANLAQVTINLLDYEITPIHIAYEEVCKDAGVYKLPVTGSEIVGLVPLNALLLAADYYIEKENLFILEEDQKVHLAINRLGLNSLGSFNPNERIIEYKLKSDSNQLLTDLTVVKFVQSVADRTTAPGGGSVAACVASLGAALGSMVSKLCYGKKIFEHNDSEMREIIPKFHAYSNELLTFVDTDANAFVDYVKALKLPHTTNEEIKIREIAIEAGIKHAIHVPFQLAMKTNTLWQPLAKLVNLSAASMISDLQVSVHCLNAGIMGAYYNVLINLKESKDDKFRQKISKDIEDIRQTAEKRSSGILKSLHEKFIKCSAS